MDSQPLFSATANRGGFLLASAIRCIISSASISPARNLAAISSFVSLFAIDASRMVTGLPSTTARQRARRSGFFVVAEIDLLAAGGAGDLRAAQVQNHVGIVQVAAVADVLHDAERLVDALQVALDLDRALAHQTDPAGGALLVVRHKTVHGSTSWLHTHGLLADDSADDLRQPRAVRVAPRQPVGEDQGQRHREVQMPPCPRIA